MATKRLTVLPCVLTVLVLVFINNWSYSYGATPYQEAYTAGIAKLNANDYAGAKTDFEVALTLAVTTIEKQEARWRLGNCYEGLKDETKLRSEYEAVIAIDNTTYWAMQADIEIARLLEKQGKPQEAIPFYLAVLKIPGWDKNKDALFTTLPKLGVTWVTIIDTLGTPTEWTGAYSLARTYFAMKQYKQALVACERAYELVPEDNKEARERIIALAFDIVWRERLRKGSLEVQ